MIEVWAGEWKSEIKCETRNGREWFAENKALECSHEIGRNIALEIVEWWKMIGLSEMAALNEFEFEVHSNDVWN